MSCQLKKEVFLFLIILCWQLPATVFAQTVKNEPSASAKVYISEEIKIKQRGTELQLSFPKTSFRSALKIMNTNGAVMKAVMIDEGIESISVSLSSLPKGIYQCVIENRTQRFVKKVLLQ